MVEFRLLGAVDLELTHAALPQSVLSRPKDLALLTYLSLAQPRGMQRRDTLLALFWPESDDSHARGALNQSLYRLRQALGEDLFVTRGAEEVGIDWNGWWCDVVEMRAASAARHYAAVLDLYRGELLSGFHADASAEFEQWLDAQRNAAREAAAAAAVQLANAAEAAGNGGLAIEFLRKALAINPFDESCLQRLMELLHRNGSAQRALTEYESFSARLAADIGAQPSGPTQRLAERIRQDLAAAPEAVAAAQPAKLRVDQRPTRRAHRRAAMLAIAVAGVALVVPSAYMLRARAFSAGTPSTIVLADFINRTSEEHLGAAVTEALNTDLSQSTVIRTTSAAQVGAVLKRMGKDTARVLTADLAREVALREGLKAVLRGEVAAFGSGYLITAQLITADSGRVLLSARETAARAEEIIPAIDRLSERLRKRMGDSLRGAHANQPLAAVTTSSLEALKLYSAGLRTVRYADAADGNSSGGLPGRVRADDQAVSLLEQAIALDTTFASAYRALGVHLYWLGDQRTRVRQLLTRAYELRHNLTERERLQAEGTYFHFVTGDYDRAIACFSQMLERDPNDIVAIQHLGYLYFRRQDFARAAQMYERDWRLRGGAPAMLYTQALLGAGRVERADSIIEHFASLDSTGNLWRAELIRLRAGRGDFAAVDTLLPRMQALAAKSGPQLQFQAQRFAGLWKIWRGRYSEGVALLHGTDLGSELPIARFEIYVLHDPAAARRRLDAALARTPLASIPPGDRPYWFLAIVYAQAGDHAQAARVLSHAPRPQLPWTSANATSPVEYQVQALAAAGRGDIALARRLLTQSEHEAGCWYMTQSLPLMRAIAEETAGQRDSVIAALERLVAPPTCQLSLSWSDQWGPVTQAYAHERLGQLYDARGDTRRAILHYAKFVELWPDPDPLLRGRWQAAKNRIAELSKRPPQHETTS